MSSACGASRDLHTQKRYPIGGLSKEKNRLVSSCEMACNKGGVRVDSVYSWTVIFSIENLNPWPWVLFPD